jgi:carbamoyltransferase
MYVLGLWDGHDAGACIVDEEGVVYAANEERFNRKKLSVGFPRESVKSCLDYLKLKPGDIEVVAANTVDFGKTLTRVFPSMKEKYYLFRRRKISKPPLVELRKTFKHTVTEIPELPFCKRVSEFILHRDLDKLGFRDYRLELVGHHTAHVAAAALCSGFTKSLIITLDGVGDALSGTVNIYHDGEIECLSSIPARDSFGLFFEQVTDLLGMRELEDEGKVMALSDFAFHVPDEENRLIDFFKVEGLKVKCNYSTRQKYVRLKKILWNTPREEFAYMAQRTLEKHITQLFENAIEETGVRNVCWSGGVASNIKVNLKIRTLPKLDKWFVFPHMGDGGLAVGSALYVSMLENNLKPKAIQDVFFGPDYDENAVEASLRKHNLSYEKRSDCPELAGDLISKGNFVLWYQGRMEFGPRALGNRSILAPADSLEIKDKLNLQIKKRNWFQPFCPSLLEEEAKVLFKDVDSFDRFMTMGYTVKEEMVEHMKAIINVDRSARPQMLGGENPPYRRLIEAVKKETGYGVVLNTSFNLHGYPIVNTPEDALEVFLKTGADYILLENYFVRRNGI